MRLEHSTFWQMNLPHSRLINCAPPALFFCPTPCVLLATATVVRMLHAKIPKDINKLDDNCTGSSYNTYTYNTISKLLPPSHAHPHAAHYATPTPTHTRPKHALHTQHTYSTHTHAHTLLKVSHTQSKELFLCNVISCAI